MDANDIKNLVFFAIAIAAWGTQALLKRNQEAQAQRQRSLVEGGGGDAADAAAAFLDQSLSSQSAAPVVATASPRGE